MSLEKLIGCVCCLALVWGCSSEDSGGSKSNGTGGSSSGGSSTGGTSSSGGSSTGGTSSTGGGSSSGDLCLQICAKQASVCSGDEDCVAECEDYRATCPDEVDARSECIIEQPSLECDEDGDGASTPAICESLETAILDCLCASDDYDCE